VVGANAFSTPARVKATWLHGAAIVVLACGVIAMDRPTMAAPAVDVVELTVDQAQAALASRRYSARQLAEACLTRIARYNPRYNAIITPNPEALAEADAIDRRRAAGEQLGPLAGIPIVVKDTVDMRGLPTTAGWKPLSAATGGVSLVPERDAPVVARLRAAGVVILGKTNVPVFSGSDQNANDSWAGPTLNATVPLRMPGGSSAGTATAVASSMAVWGVAEETGGSIQFPAGYQGLVGIKTTFGLVPTVGVVPLGGSTRDVLGPIARTVRDAAFALDAMAGPSAEDSKTTAAQGHLPPDGYVAALKGATLKGQRIGLYGPGWLDKPLKGENKALYERAVHALERMGAVLVRDPFAATPFASLAKPTGDWQYDQRGEESVAYDMDQYLRRLGPSAAIHSVAELVRVTGQDPFSETGPLAYERAAPELMASLADLSKPPDLSRFQSAREQYLRVFNEVMDRQHLDALVYPQALDEPPPLMSGQLGWSTTESQINIAGLPGVVVPAGYYNSGSPFTLMWVGRQWDEARLLRLAYAYEQHTRARRAPALQDKPR
jgi:Asp-tRNA(Asn)/Glu-tRNA(Gln) amidotransferase A subunit family amidase